MVHALHFTLGCFSSSFPNGAFAYSYGLEQYVARQEVKDAIDLEAYIVGLIHSGSIWNDLLCIKFAHEGQSPDGYSLDDLALALLPSKERVLETKNLASSFTRFMRHVYDTEVSGSSYPVVLGRATCALKVPLTHVMSGYLHGFVMNLILVGVRIIPIGQLAGQKILHNLFDEMERVVAKAGDAQMDDFGGFAVCSDISSMNHEFLEKRNFIT